MMREIVWARRALRQLDNNIKYLEENWTQKEIDRFIDIIKQYEMMISNNPEMFPLSQNHKGCRKCVITKQTIIYFKIKADKIQIHAFWDNRQNPDKLDLNG